MTLGDFMLANALPLIVLASAVALKLWLRGK
jgi:hypothetical protein